MANVDVDTIRDYFWSKRQSADLHQSALAGFGPTHWIKRAGAGHCVHTDITGTYLHINNGWDYSRQVIVPGHFRTPDFVKVEQAFEPLGILPVTFGELVSFNGQLWRTNGLWNYPVQAGNDHTTSNVYSSDTGGLWIQDALAPLVDRECSMALAHTDGFLYIGMGERYNTTPPPTYIMPLDIWRRGTSWTQRSSTMHARRSFSYFSWGNAIVIGCGRDDTSYPTVVDLNDFITSIDGGVTWSNLGLAHFVGAYGRRATPFLGGIVLTGGANGFDGITKDTNYLNEVWFSTTPLDPTSWVAMPPMPIACVHHVAAVLPINGIPTLGIIGGYNSNARPDGSPFGTIFTTTDLQTWTPRIDSGFWVN